MESGEIMNLNWNRMSMLSALSKRSELQQTEFDMRIAFQNAFANAMSDEECEKVALSVQKTFDEALIKTIRAYVKKK